MGGGSGPSRTTGSVNDNIRRLEQEFGPLRNGYFGRPGSSSRNRTIDRPNPDQGARRFFDLARHGGPKVQKMRSSRGGILRFVRFRDGSTVGLRMDSKSKGPSLEISPSNIGGRLKEQKIHFIRSEK